MTGQETVIRAYIEGSGYERRMMSDGHYSMVPMDEAPVLAALAALVAERDTEKERCDQAIVEREAWKYLAAARGKDAQWQADLHAQAVAERDRYRDALKEAADHLYNAKMQMGSARGEHVLQAEVVIGAALAVSA